jgi:hypothetical protein
MRINIKLTLVFIVFLGIFPCYSDDDVINLYINDEPYYREYPSTLEESRQLIDELIVMYNELNRAFIDYRFIDKNEKLVLTQQINKLEEIILYGNTLVNNVKDVTSSINSRLDALRRAMKNNLLLIASVGPSYNSNDNLWGSALGIGFLKNLNVLNLYGGSNLNLTIYYPSGRNTMMDIGISLYLGMFLN